MEELNSPTYEKQEGRINTKLPLIWITTSILAIIFLVAIIWPSLTTFTFGVISTMAITAVLTWKILQE